MSKTINPITQEEKDRIDKVKKKNENMEQFFVEKRAQWNKSSEEIYTIVSIDLSATSSAKEVFEAQAKALTLRQQISDTINYFINKRSSESSNLKALIQEKTVYYLIGFPVKASAGSSKGTDFLVIMLLVLSIFVLVGLGMYARKIFNER